MVTKDLITIKRPTGDYMVNVNDDDEMSKADATRKCASYGAVLASITEKSDYDAIIDVLLQDNEDERRWRSYHVGLDITKDNSSRIFPNGVSYDFAKHGAFYKDNIDNFFKDPNRDDLCISAFLSPWNRTEAAIWTATVPCNGMLTSFICFKPNKPNCWSAEALVEEKSIKHETYMFGAIFTFFCMTVIAVLFAIYYRRSLQRTKKDMEKMLKTTC